MADEVKVKKHGNNSTAIIATVVVISLVVAVAAIVILLVVSNTGVQDNDTITIGQITVNNDSCSSNPTLSTVQKQISNPKQEPIQVQVPAVIDPVKSNDNTVRGVVSPTSQIPTFIAMAEGDGEDMASVHGRSIDSGIMNATAEAREKKWDPEKNFPSRSKPERSSNTLGSQFGPDETQMQMYLPTPEEIFASRGHVSGPKIIRRGPRFLRGNDWRPIMIPEDYKDYDKVTRPNRPRINEEYYREAIEQERRIYKNALPSIVPALAN